MAAPLRVFPSDAICSYSSLGAHTGVVGVVQPWGRDPACAVAEPVHEWEECQGLRGGAPGDREGTAMGGLQVRRHQVGSDRGPYSDNKGRREKGLAGRRHFSKEAAY